MVGGLGPETTNKVRAASRETTVGGRGTHGSFAGLLASCADFRFRTRDSKIVGSMLCSAQTVGIDSWKASGLRMIAGIILFKV